MSQLANQIAGIEVLVSPSGRLPRVADRRNLTPQ